MWTVARVPNQWPRSILWAVHMVSTTGLDFFVCITAANVRRPGSNSCIRRRSRQLLSGTRGKSSVCLVFSMAHLRRSPRVSAGSLANVCPMRIWLLYLGTIGSMQRSACLSIKCSAASLMCKVGMRVWSRGSPGSSPWNFVPVFWMSRVLTRTACLKVTRTSKSTNRASQPPIRPPQTSREVSGAGPLQPHKVLDRSNRLRDNLYVVTTQSLVLNAVLLSYTWYTEVNLLWVLAVIGYVQTICMDPNSPCIITYRGYEYLVSI